jgi:nicotinamide-nucleotide amidase
MNSAADVIKRAAEAGMMVATAESCTGGLIAGALTDVAGSSAVFDCGFVTYSNEAKVDMLGVPMALIDEHGAVSAEVAEAMAAGALANSRAEAAVSVTGIAGPGGGSAEKPVGLVFMGVATLDNVAVTRHVFRTADDGIPDRQTIRQMTVQASLAALYAVLPPTP